MKKLFVILLLATCNRSILIYANCENLKTREEVILCNTLKMVKTKESFQSSCYVDGKTKNGKNKHSIGFGMAEGFGNNNYCQKAVDKLKKENIRYRLIPDYILFKKIKVNEKQAELMTLESLNGFLKRLRYNYKLNAKKDILKAFNNKQIEVLLDRIYRAGETKFYKTENQLWLMLINDDHRCIQLAKAFMQGAKVNGVKARYHSELLMFTSEICFYDIRFQKQLFKI